MDEPTFRYARVCSGVGCTEPPLYKVVAAWTYGPLREWKNYGLACERHLPEVLDRARRNRQGLTLVDDEAVGPVVLIRLDPPTPAALAP